MRVLLGVGALLPLMVSACEPKQAPTQSEEAIEVVEALENRQAPVPDRPLVAGQDVYDFNALVHTGQRIRLSGFSDRPVVVYFCPNHRHPKCTELATAIRDVWLEMHAHVSMVLAVSADDIFVGRDFASEFELPHVLVPDPDGKVHQMFGLQPGVSTSYLIGRDRKVLRVLDTTDAIGHAHSIAKSLQDLGQLSDPYPI